MSPKLVADKEGRIWGGLTQGSDAQWFSPSLDRWSPYKNLTGPMVRYDPMREVLVAFSRGRLTRDLDDAVAERRLGLNIFEEHEVKNAYSD